MTLGRFAINTAQMVSTIPIQDHNLVFPRLEAIVRVDTFIHLVFRTRGF